MTHEQVLAKLRDILDGDYDPERNHSQADDALRDFVRALGYGDVADAYDAIEPKWCA